VNIGNDGASEALKTRSAGTPECTVADEADVSQIKTDIANIKDIFLQALAGSIR
jgi:hypothetical protein